MKKEAQKRPPVPFRKVLRIGFGYTLKAIPVLFAVINLIAIVHGVSYGFTTFMTQRFYDAVETALRGASVGGALRGAYLSVAALGLAMLLCEILNGVHNFLHDIYFTKLRGEMTRIIHEKMARIDPVCLEDPRLHDDINKAQEGSGTLAVVIGIGITIFTFYLPYFIFMAVYLYYLKPLFIVSMAPVFLPTLVGQLMRTAIIEKFEDKAAPIRRELDAHERAITHRDFFKETRLLGGYTFFLRLLRDTVTQLGKAEWEAGRKTNLINLGANVLTILGYGGILFMLFDALLAGEITVGAFAAVYGAVGLLFSLMQEIVQGHVGHITSNLGKAHNFIRFMELPERCGSPARLHGRAGREASDQPQPNAGIKLRNATFRYPNAEKDSLCGITLTIPYGQTVAIVGENGAGKTTLARLLTGIYRPTTGSVTLRGLDTATAGTEDLFKGVSGVFQKYQRYQMTLAENIRISEGYTDSGAALDTVIGQASVKLEDGDFPSGVDTMLSREFDGVDLSGGEWQRVAIARGLYRTHDTILLDEPTAAIDPLEESRIYRRFIEIAQGKTAVIITHRLGSTKIADRVLVMDKGLIIGDGTHDSLMQSCPLYRDLYAAQADWYSERTDAVTIP